jgi:hypothetical protein
VRVVLHRLLVPQRVLQTSSWRQQQQQGELHTTPWKVRLLEHRTNHPELVLENQSRQELAHQTDHLQQLELAPELRRVHPMELLLVRGCQSQSHQGQERVPGYQTQSHQAPELPREHHRQNRNPQGQEQALQKLLLELEPRRLEAPLERVWIQN